VRRRTVIAALGGAAAWPVVARGQQATLPMVGVLSVPSRGSLTDALAAFYRVLNEAGYVEGQNVAIEYRWAY
jgi:putative ABC transport system substrate-binding protein